MLLIVVYAIVNSLPLLYVPKFALCVFNFDPKENDFLKESALHFDSDILSKAQLTQLKRTDNVVTCLKSFSTDFDAVYYLFDEHHENYEVKAEYEKYFTIFKGWTLETTCEKSVTIYSGSAHSKFEDNLPKEDMLRIIRITPPTWSEFETLVQNFGYGKLDEESLFKIEYATGRIPKEIRIFSLWYPKSFTDNDIRMFISRRREVFYQRLRRMQKLYESETQNFITTIHRLFNMAFLSDSELTSRSIHVDGPLYDVGLLFKNSDNEVFPITEGAKHALFSFYIDNCNTSELNSLEDGCTIRRRSIFNEYKKSDFHTKFLLTDGSSAIIKYNISSHSSFDMSTMDMVRSLSRKRWLEGDSILFIPKSQQFPVIDYLIVTYEKKKIQIVLKKAISTVNEHQYDQSDLRELSKPVYLVGENQIYHETSPFQIKERRFKVTKEYCYSLFELIVHSILDNYNTCSPVVLQVEKKDDQDNTFIETKQTELRRKVFKYKPTTGRTLKVNEAEISWYFVYETIKTGQ